MLFTSAFEFVTEECCNCGIAFAVTKDFQRRRLDDHKPFYCPAGHQQHYTGKSEAQKLREEVARKEEMLDAERARSNAIRHERDSIQRAHTKMRVRVMNGVCPCCNRTFQNLLNHMKTEHADQFTLKHLRTVFGMSQAAVADEAGVSTSHISLFERERPVPAHAKDAIERWVTKHEGKA